MQVTTSLTNIEDEELIYHLQDEADQIASIGDAVQRPDNREEYITLPSWKWSILSIQMMPVTQGNQ